MVQCVKHGQCKDEIRIIAVVTHRYVVTHLGLLGIHLFEMTVCNKALRYSLLIYWIN